MTGSSSGRRLVLTNIHPAVPRPHVAHLVLDFGPPLVLAAFLLAVTPLEANSLHAQRLGALPMLEIAASALALAGRRRHALLAYGGSAGFAALYPFTGHPPGPVLLAPSLGLAGVIARA